MTGKCVCLPNFTGAECNQCRSSTWQSSNDCLDCQCDTEGTLDNSDVCEQSSGQCPCREGRGGLRCDEAFATLRAENTTQTVSSEHTEHMSCPGSWRIRRQLTAFLISFQESFRRQAALKSDSSHLEVFFTWPLSFSSRLTS